MGRSDTVHDPSAAIEFEVTRLRWVNDSYDEGGAYWGRSQTDKTRRNEHIYRAYAEGHAGVEEAFVRSVSYDEAVKAIRGTYPNATFSLDSEALVMCASYEEAALFSSGNMDFEEDPDNQSEFLDGSGAALSELARAAMLSDCRDFLLENRDLVRQALDQGMDIEAIGSNFWMTRNRHGTGFWDDDLGDLGDKLTDAAHAFGEVDLYLGDDNEIHASNEHKFEAPTP